MKKVAKAVGITAALALAIPLGVYAASGTTSSTSSDQAVKSGWIAEAGFGHPGGFGKHGAGFVSQEVLDVLKLDQASLEDKLQDGKTLAQIAEEQGISRDALKTAMTESFNKRLEEHKTQFTQNLDRMIDSTMPAKPFGGKGFGIKQDLSGAAKILGVTEADVKAAFEDGKSLADLAKEKNVDVQKLIDSIKNAAVEQINQAVKDGKITQEQADERIADADDMAEKIVNGSGFHRGFRGDHFKHRGHGM